MKVLLGQRGMTIALVLWMIAGMALTVAAVIHFSRGDTEAVEFRLQQARADAAGRGAAWLVLRDRRQQTQQATETLDEVELEQLQEEGNFKRAYQFDGVTVTAEILPGNRLVSLNDASPANLVLLFEEVGLASSGQAQQLASSVMGYRDQSSAVSFEAMYHPGFRFREELLMMPGITRDVYDRVRAWVHPFHTGDTNLGDLRENEGGFTDISGITSSGSVTSRGRRETGDSSGNAGASAGTGGGLLTFDSMYENMKKRQDGGTAPTLISIEAQFVDDSQFHQLVWVDTINNRIVRAQTPVRVVKK